jgi:hypothetical protein
MAILSKAQILAAPDIVTEPVKVPEWGGEVLVRSLDGTQRDEYEQSIMVRRGKSKEVNLRNARVKLLVRTIVDSDGELLFSEQEIAALGRKSAAALQRVFEKSAELAGLSDKDLDELTENFDDGQSDGSTSD